jgi:hypothetical protein
LLRESFISNTNFKSLSNFIFLPSARQETEPCSFKNIRLIVPVTGTQECQQSNGFLKAINGTQKRQQYKEFYKIINTLILQRESSLLSKQVNIFTSIVKGILYFEY